MQQDLDFRGLPMETLLGVADVLDRLAGRGLDNLRSDGGRPSGLTGQHDGIGGRKSLARDPAERVGGQEQVYNGIGNPIADLVGMALGNAFGNAAVSALRGALGALRELAGVFQKTQGVTASGRGV